MCVSLHERLQALCDVGLPQRYRSVGLWTLQGSLVFLAAHQTQYGVVQILVLLLQVTEHRFMVTPGILQHENAPDMTLFLYKDEVVTTISGKSYSFTMTFEIASSFCSYDIIKHPGPHEVGHPGHLVDVYFPFLL